MAQQTRTVAVEAGRSEARPAGEGRGRSLDDLAGTASPGFYGRAWRQFRRNRVALAGLVMTVAVILFVLSADLISGYVTGVGYADGNLRNRFAPPFSAGHPLGTDLNGRDLLTRLAYGGRISLMVAGLATVAILAIGGTIGAVAGYFGGLVDSVAMRFVDILLSLPGLAILLLVSTIFSPGPIGLAFVIAAISWTTIARLVRGQVLELRHRDFVDAARILGASHRQILIRHILPNVVPLIIVFISLQIPILILVEATLSFLGFGVQIPIPSWGNMLQDASGFYMQSMWNVFLPGFMIYIAVLAINLVGDGLRDALDPRLND